MSQNNEPVRVALHVEAFGGSEDHELEIPRDEWDAMSLAARQTLLDDEAEEFATNYVAWGWHIDDAEDYAAATEDGAR